jgi:hypothetical protein
MMLYLHLAILCRPMVYLLPNNYLAFQPFDFEYTWWRLFQKPSTTLTQWHPLSEGIQFTIRKNYTNLDISNFEPQCMSHGDNTFARSGYDIPLHGIGHSCFYTIHVIALVCLIMSLSSAVTVIVVYIVVQN